MERFPNSARPTGVPVARALIIAPGIANDDLREAVDAVSRVHGDGELPPIAASLSSTDLVPAAPPADGRFGFDAEPDGTILARSITIRSDAPNRAFVFVHEIGHAIDAVGLPGVGFSSAALTARERDGWREAVARSAAFHELERLEGGLDPELRARAIHLVQADELWARSYAQFVATRSSSRVLRSSLDALRRRSASAVY